MHEKDWDKFIQQAKENYRKIVAVSCPAFGGELVYFNRYGWKHIIAKGRKKRDIVEILKRISYLKYAPQVISIIRSLADYKVTIINGLPVHYWAAHQRIDNIMIRIIIRRLNNGRKHFFSIMEERK